MMLMSMSVACRSCLSSLPCYEVRQKYLHVKLAPESGRDLTPMPNKPVILPLINNKSVSFAWIAQKSKAGTFIPEGSWPHEETANGLSI